MDIDQLVEKLREMYYGADKGEEVAMIHLFAIKYAHELGHIPSTEIARRAKLRDTNAYHSEISKGRKLAKFVDVKPEYRDTPTIQG